MYKKTAIIITIILCFTYYIPVLSYAAEAPEIDCPAAILIDSASGRILYERNMHQKMYPASITKIMTAVLALERGNLKDMVTASLDAVTSVGPGGSHIGILPGETLSLEDLLYGLMVASANDGANVIGEYISGSMDEFVNLMNQRAIELGAINTHFTNTNGMPDDEHVTTAYDMAMIAKHAMTIPKFREIVSTSYYEIEPTEKYKEKRYLSNTNHLINKYRATKSYNYYYEPAIGIKTGYTDQANYTLAGAARKNRIELITVVMGGKAVDGKLQIYEDTIKLLEYGFNNFSTQTIVRPG
ncbi:MAG: D-alanyl-D-alanine carboxypeptidase, partial [Clostridiaceae bacterium]|nr:D-alanyl-D-alanine carboxypeptidase [Clostridiaceae bacterium]